MVPVADGKSVDSSRFRLSLLGHIDLTGPDGRRVQSVLSQPKRLALLAYLAVEGREGFVRRDALTATFLASPTG